jgi:two-component system KDP operon response regulator KdpE
MTVAMHLALIVDHDATNQEALRILFEDSGFRVASSNAARLVRKDVRVHRSDVVVVDVSRPGGGGIDLVQAIRSWSSVPIVVLAVSTAEGEQIAALEKGADDYICRPFSPAELMARVRAILRRHARGELPMGMLQLGKASIDLGMRTAQCSDGGPLRLTPVEHRILEVLVRHANQIVPSLDLLREVWGPHQSDSRVLRVNIRNLRTKLEEDPRQPRYIVTESGMGYRLVLDSPG